MSIYKEIETLKPTFSAIAKIHGAVDFAIECQFAQQALANNPFLAKVAEENKDSLFDAILNVANIGISLNPALKRAYLVPRDGKAILDISYMGLCHLALEGGSILWVQADLVYLNDQFLFSSMGEKPVHKFNPFATLRERGEFIGAYCVAKTHNGDFLTTMMSEEEVNKIKERSAGWKAHVSKGKSTVWNDFFGEMGNKTVIKRASKMWPKNKRSEALDVAIDVDNKNQELPIEEQHDLDMAAKIKAQERLKPLLTAKIENLKVEERGPFLKTIGLKSLADLKNLKTFELERISDTLEGKPVQITTEVIPW